MLPVSFYFFVETWDAFWSRTAVHCSSVTWLVLAEEQLFKLQLKLVLLFLPLSIVLCKIICAVKKKLYEQRLCQILGDIVHETFKSGLTTLPIQTLLFWPGGNRSGKPASKSRLPRLISCQEDAKQIMWITWFLPMMVCCEFRGVPSH